MEHDYAKEYEEIQQMLTEELVRTMKKGRLNEKETEKNLQ